MLAEAYLAAARVDEAAAAAARARELASRLANAGTKGWPWLV